MANEYVFYNKTTGEIIGRGRGSITNAGPSGMIEGSYDSSVYYVEVATGTVEKRPSFAFTVSGTSIPADGKTEIKITNIPTGTVVSYDAKNYTINDGELDFTTTDVGTHVLSFTLFPYVPYSETITATTVTGASS